MKVCVTGAAGFVGRHVCKALTGAGHDVIGLDVCPRSNMDQEWITADITQTLLPIWGLDAVIHLAAVAHPRECEADHARTFAVNVNGTYHVLQMALESGAKKFVFASTAHVYGISPKYLPTSESHPLGTPLWRQHTYSRTKILGEQLCKRYYENDGLSCTILRLYNAYGSGQGRGYFIPDMLEMARRGRIELTGGSTTKDFVYVEDVARAFVLAIEAPFGGALTLNIGTGRESRLEDVASAIAMHLEVPYSDTGDEYRQTRMRADISRAGEQLGWKPQVSLEEGIRAVVDGATAKV